MASHFKTFAEATDDDAWHGVRDRTYSIIEAILYDLHLLVKTFTSEGVANLQAMVIDYIRGKKIDELERYIASAKKHDLFDQGESGFYEGLDDLRKIRNRLHIQNTKKQFEPDDVSAFRDHLLGMRERRIERNELSAVAETIRGDVEDAHDQRAIADW